MKVVLKYERDSQGGRRCYCGDAGQVRIIMYVPPAVWGEDTLEIDVKFPFDDATSSSQDLVREQMKEEEVKRRLLECINILIRKFIEQTKEIQRYEARIAELEAEVRDLRRERLRYEARIAELEAEVRNLRERLEKEIQREVLNKARDSLVVHGD